MHINYVDPDTIKVNPDAVINNKKIGEKNHSLIVVDDFLMNPDQLITDYVEHVPVTLNRVRDDSIMPGWIGEVDPQLKQVDAACTQLLDMFTDFSIPDHEIDRYRWNYQLNVIHGGGDVIKKSLQPHVDPAMYAWVLYLNKDEDCRGGTAFYKHCMAGDMNLEHIERSWKRTADYWKFKEWEFENIRDTQNDYVEFDSKNMDDAWEEYHYEPMKFNKLIIYPSYIYHSALMKKDWFVDSPRISISGFIHHSWFIN